MSFPEPWNVSVFGNSVTADVFQLYNVAAYWNRISPQSSMIGVRIREEETQKHREEWHVKTEAEIGVLCLQTKDTKHCQQPQKLGEKHGEDCSSEPLVGTHPSDTLTLDI